MNEYELAVFLEPGRRDKVLGTRGLKAIVTADSEEHAKELGIRMLRPLLKDNVRLTIDVKNVTVEVAGLFWTSLLIQDTDNSKPWVCAMTEGCLSFEEAEAFVTMGLLGYRVLSAWIDTFDTTNVKTTVWHKSYIN